MGSKFIFLAICFVLLFCQEAAGKTLVASVVCKASFHKEISWDPNQKLCDYRGRTWTNTWGQYALSFSGCVMGISTNGPENQTIIEDVVFKSMGECGCPSNCSETFRGTCVNQKCECSKGYSGDDCVSVSCDLEQSCSNRGFCTGTVTPGWDVCACDFGFSGVDCSANMGNPPPIQKTLNIPQYTSWDEYGDNNPIFDEGSIAVINVEMDPADLKFYMEPKNTQTNEYRSVNMVIVLFCFVLFFSPLLYLFFLFSSFPVFFFCFFLNCV